MQKLYEALIGSALGCASAVAARVAPRFLDRGARLRERDVSYLPSGETDPIRSSRCVLDVYEPAARGTGALPVSIFVHGGGFGYFSKDSHAAAASTLAAQGRLVLALNYRLAGMAPYPAALRDVEDAYRWTLANAGSRGGNLSRISFVGESAGANLSLGATLAALGLGVDGGFASSVRPTALPKRLVLHCGHLQVSNSVRYSDDSARASIVRARVRMIESRYLGRVSAEGVKGSLADPLLVLEELLASGRGLPADFPEIFIPVGGNDPVIGDSIRLEKVVRMLGGHATLKTYPGEGHAFYAFPFRRAARECWRDIDAFLNGAREGPGSG